MDPPRSPTTSLTPSSAAASASSTHGASTHWASARKQLGQFWRAISYTVIARQKEGIHVRVGWVAAWTDNAASQLAL